MTNLSALFDQQQKLVSRHHSNKALKPEKRKAIFNYTTEEELLYVGSSIAGQGNLTLVCCNCRGSTIEWKVLLYTALIWSAKNVLFTAVLEGICATLNLLI